MTAGGIVYISQYLVASAVTLYAPSLLDLGSAMAGIWRSWQDHQPGTFQKILCRLQNYILDDLFGPPAVPTTHSPDNGSIMQQVRLQSLGTKVTASYAVTPAVRSE